METEILQPGDRIRCIGGLSQIAGTPCYGGAAYVPYKAYTVRFVTGGIVESTNGVYRYAVKKCNSNSTKECVDYLLKQK